MEEKRRSGSSEPENEIIPAEKEINSNEENNIEINNNKLQNVDKEDKKNKKKKKEKFKITKRMVICIVLIAICKVVTVLLITLKLKQLDEAYTYVEEEENVFETENKVDDDDLKYVVTDSDTLDYNNLEYETIYVANGEESTTFPSTGIDYQYIIIDGLKDESVENNINSTIKEKVLELRNSTQATTYVYVMGNFNGILSLRTYISGGEIVTMNFDLNTGNEFFFEDVFVKSAPIVNILYNALLETVALGTGKSMTVTDMNDIDTSDYEELLFKINSWYQSNKGDIQFTVSPTVAYVFNVQIDGTSYTLEIPLYENKEYIAIYKRYLNNNLFDINEYNTGYVAFSKPVVDWDDGRSNLQFVYGRLTDNVYADIAIGVSSTLTLNDMPNQIYSYAQSIADSMAEETKQKATSDPSRGYILQAEFYIWYDDSTGYISSIGGYAIEYYTLTLRDFSVDIPIEDYANVNEYLAKAALTPTSAADLMSLKYYFSTQGMYGIESSDIYNTDTSFKYYFDANGNYLGDDISVVKDENHDMGVS